MKTVFLILLIGFSVGCSTTSERSHSLKESAVACNDICKANPEISEVSFKAGGGMPLIFLGGMEQKCGCSRRN